MHRFALDQRLSTSTQAAHAFRAGRWAEAVALDPTFALAHATLALVGHECGEAVDICSRLRDAELHARRSSEIERRQVEAIVRYVRGQRRLS